MRIHRRTTRPAFTLTEMLVATALCLFIMAVIGEAVGQATRTFTKLRTAGQLQERTRGVITTMRRDLATDHFAGPYPGGRGGPMVGMQRMDVAGWQPPDKGYLEITQVQNPQLPAGQATILEPYAAPTMDAEGLGSTRATTHYLRFTIRLPVGTPTELFTARVVMTNPATQGPVAAAILRQGGNEFLMGPVQAPPAVPDNIYYSRWAEVAYFLLASGDFTPGGAALPLHSLRRKHRILAPSTGPVGTLLTADAIAFGQANPDLALRLVPATATTATIIFQGPDDVADRANRILAGTANPLLLAPAADPTGSDVLQSDVIGFEVKAAWGANQAARPTYNPSDPANSNPVPYLFEFLRPLSSPFPLTMANNPSNSDEPYSDLPPTTLNPDLFGVRTFDTWYRNFKNDGIDWDSPTTSSNGFGFLDYANSTQPAYPVSRNNVPLRVNVRSIQIKLRIWDVKAEQARQVTIMQEI